MRLHVLTTAALAVGLWGCANKSEAPAYGEAPAPATAANTAKSPAPAPVQQAKVTGAAPGAPASQPASMPSGKALPPGHPPTGGTALPPGHPPAGGALPPGHPPAGGNVPAMPPPGGGTLDGTITLDDAMKAKVKAGSVLFIIVRKDEGEGKRGMLLAAKKIPVSGAAMFPFTYQVGPSDIMMQGTQLAGAVRVEARIDQDGDAISKTPGDVIGARAAANNVGDKGVDFVLNSSL